MRARRGSSSGPHEPPYRTCRRWGAASHETDAVVVGETVTRAVALQECAMAGTILCSEATARLVQRMVCPEAMPLDVCGRASDTGENLSGTGTAYATRARRAAPGACPDALCRPGAELATLHAVWAHVTRDRDRW